MCEPYRETVATRLERMVVTTANRRTVPPGDNLGPAQRVNANANPEASGSDAIGTGA